MREDLLVLWEGAIVIFLLGVIRLGHSWRVCFVRDDQWEMDSNKQVKFFTDFCNNLDAAVTRVDSPCALIKFTPAYGRIWSKTKSLRYRTTKCKAVSFSTSVETNYFRVFSSASFYFTFYAIISDFIQKLLSAILLRAPTRIRNIA